MTRSALLRPFLKQNPTRHTSRWNLEGRDFQNMSLHRLFYTHLSPCWGHRGRARPKRTITPLSLRTLRTKHALLTGRIVTVENGAPA